MTASLLSEHDLLVLDLDGVVYVGPDAVPGAVDALAAAIQAGVALRYVTNNASRTPAQVAAHLRRLGVPARDTEGVTASQAAARLVAEKTGPGAAVLAVGGPGVAAALRAEGLTVVT
ncbi:MAG: HAD family hydrolase, partial [Actinomycetota bacterium]